MRVLLIMPFMNFDESKYLSSTDSSFPSGLGYIAAVLVAAGHQVKIFDFQLKKNTLTGFKQLLAQVSFDMFGFSVTTVTRNNALQLMRICRSRQKFSKIIAGGPHVTINPGELLAPTSPLDFEVIGEGEKTIVELLECIHAKGCLRKVRGIAFRTGHQVHITTPRPLINNLDIIPFPAFELFELDLYKPPPGQCLQPPLRFMSTSRGCPHHCIFCETKALWNNRCRLRSAENIIAEMKILKNKYHAREIQFYDDTFTISKKRIYRLCQGLKTQGIDLFWRCSARVDTVDPLMLKMMFSAGCRSIFYGFESGDDQILKRMHKGTTVAQARAAVQWTRAAGIQAKGYFMLNFPGETIATTEKTLKLAKELDIDFAVFHLTVPHSSKELKKLVEQNYALNQKIYYDPETTLGNQIFFFQPALPPKYLAQAYSRAAREFYLRPVQIIRILKTIRSFTMLQDTLLGLIRIFKLKL